MNQLNNINILIKGYIFNLEGIMKIINLRISNIKDYDPASNKIRPEILSFKVNDINKNITDLLGNLSYIHNYIEKSNTRYNLIFNNLEQEYMDNCIDYYELNNKSNFIQYQYPEKTYEFTLKEILEYIKKLIKCINDYNFVEADSISQYITKIIFELEKEFVETNKKMNKTIKYLNKESKIKMFNIH